jgi:hypothetical protein
MNFLNIWQIGCMALLASSLQAAYSPTKYGKPACQSYMITDCKSKPHFGMAGFSVTDPNLWYTIETNSYPDGTLLSQGRNKGSVEGSVYLSPTGFTIGEAGNYWVNITAILQNPEDTNILIPVYLVRDDTFDPTDPLAIGGVATIKTEELITIQGSGVLEKVTPGTRLSLVAMNGGSESPVPVTVVAWGISLFKMP